jgi:hypothetical protein
MSARAKPRLVEPSSPPVRGTNPIYERGLRLGAIGVRRDLADECQRGASIAKQRGDEGEYYRLHRIANQAEAEIVRLTNEIAGIR